MEFFDPNKDEFCCVKCGKQLAELNELPPINAFTVVRCSSCKVLLALICGLCFELNEEVLSNSSNEVKSQYLYQVLMDNFSMLCQALAQMVAETWDGAHAQQKVLKTEAKKNMLEKLQERIQGMDLDAFNKYMDSQDSSGT